MYTPATITAALDTLKHFVSHEQLSVLRGNTRGEESDFFKSKIVGLAELVRGMPKTYEQDGKGQDAIVSLHYFRGGSDWYILERDKLDEQEQAFGLTDLGEGGELGYISIQTLIEHGIEIDLYFTPKPIKDLTE